MTLCDCRFCIQHWQLSGTNLNTAKSSILDCKPVQEHSYRYLVVPNIYTITTFISLYDNKSEKAN